MNKPTLRNYRAIQLSPVEAFLLTLKGKRDGKIGLPRQDGDGGWSSPQHSKEAKAYYGLAARKWAETEDKTAELHREMAALERKAAGKLQLLAALREEAPAAPDLSLAYPSEAGIDPATLKERRRREHLRANGRYFSKCEALRAYIEQARDKISELGSAIAENENITRLVCERAKQRTEQRITAYWHGLLCANANKSVPATPGKIAESDAEQIYFSHHGAFTREPAPKKRGGAQHEDKIAFYAE